MSPSPDRTPQGNGHLAENVAHFARVLRRAGLPVGPASVLDALAALDAVGLRSRQDFYWILHAVFVHRHEQTILFQKAFAAFWQEGRLQGQTMPSPSGPEAVPQAPEPGAARIAEALTPRAAPTPREPKEASLRLSGSTEDVLRAKDFAQMTAAEIAEAKRRVAALVMPQDARRTRRFEAASRGAIDPRRSFRRALRAGGAGIDLAFHRRETRRPPLVALVDISGSMQDYSRLFLHFLHALAEDGRRVHSFVFATRLTNITRELTRRDPDEALLRASARVQDWEGGTRIAHCLHDFNRLWSRRVLGQGASVLLITDGLEREVGDDLAFEMDRLKRSCRRLIWLNPLLRYEAFAPRAAGIRAMLPHVDDFRTLHNLGSMADLVTALGEVASRRRPPETWLRATG